MGVTLLALELFMNLLPIKKYTVYRSRLIDCKVTLLFLLFALGVSGQIKVGAEQLDLYLNKIQNKRIGVVANHTSLINNSHLVDSLLALNINVVKVFSPEHGFRGKADAGEYVDSEKDKLTGLPIISLYGKNKKPYKNQLQDVDVMLFDLQDVGVRFYTYLSTLHYVMEACAEQNIPLVVLDRPNPNIDRVDGPVLKAKNKSFVGLHPIPVLHGNTLGEMAQMINGEKWLKNEVICDLSVIKVENYTRSSLYKLPIKPSPNLPTYQSIRLYPSLCFFEGTLISIGRGTDEPFTKYGHPSFRYVMDYSFVPEPNQGAKKPKLNGKKCFGKNLVDYKVKEGEGLNLSWLMDAYKTYPIKSQFFNNFFRLLAGDDSLKSMIEEGKSEQDIKASWKTQLEEYKAVRAKYLLYY